MDDCLTFLAGKKAFQIIRDGGLRPEQVAVIAGAAGGPKWLVLNALDRFIFGRWLRDRKEPVALVGASIGAWRFAAAARFDPKAAIGRFENAYIHQRYSPAPTPDDVSRESARVLDQYLDDTGIPEILHHPYLRLNVLAVRCRGPAGRRQRPVQALALALAAAANAVDRRWLRFFFARTLFYDPRQLPPVAVAGPFPAQRVPLAGNNIKRALMASGAIPLVMSGIADIPGARCGVYRDGGVLDYHMDLPFETDADGIVLFPHYMARVIPGWLDKRLAWRRPAAGHMDRVLLVAPSGSFVDGLPLKKIPDRNDFYRFKGRDAERFACWQTVVEKSRMLAEAFAEAVETGTIREKVKPLSTAG